MSTKSSSRRKSATLASRVQGLVDDFAQGSVRGAAELWDIQRLTLLRLIKGQVFLWREGQPWEDLWDPGGRIPQ